MVSWLLRFRLADRQPISLFQAITRHSDFGSATQIYQIRKFELTFLAAARNPVEASPLLFYIIVASSLWTMA